LIKATPEKVWQTIINPYSRHIYDDMLKELTLINDLGDGMKLRKYGCPGFHSQEFISSVDYVVIFLL